MLHIPTTWAHCWCAVTECTQLSLLKMRAPCLLEESSNASMGWGKLRLSDVPIILLAFCCTPQTIPVNAHAQENIHHHHPGISDWLWLLFVPFAFFFPLGYVIELTGRKICNRVWNWAENVYISWKYLEKQGETAECVTANSRPLLDDCV